VIAFGYDRGDVGSPRTVCCERVVRWDGLAADADDAALSQRSDEFTAAAADEVDVPKDAAIHDTAVTSTRCDGRHAFVRSGRRRPLIAA
jgi:hypothetical protein